jgi:hypothetical protein
MRPVSPRYRAHSFCAWKLLAKRRYTIQLEFVKVGCFSRRLNIDRMRMSAIGH